MSYIQNIPSKIAEHTSSSGAHGAFSGIDHMEATTHVSINLRRLKSFIFSDHTGVNLEPAVYNLLLNDQRVNEQTEEEIKKKKEPGIK